MAQVACFVATNKLQRASKSYFLILTQRVYIGNGEKAYFILQQIHWAETRDII